MAATTETFQYSPLPEATEWIRILQLEPSTRPDAPLRGRLVETKLDAHADYHAVSYLWGDTKAPLTDWCELRMMKTGTSDAEHNYARLPILASCNTVLRHLRWARKTRTLWIDSVCIDQSNSAEKSRQVRIMQYIYRGASKVAMWLDLSHVPARDCKRVLKYAKMLSRAYRWGLVDIFHAKPGRISGSFKLWLIDLLPSDLRGKGGPFTETMLSIIDNPYFGRTWTVQELVMAPVSQVEMQSSLGSTIQWADILALVEFTLASRWELSLDERKLRVLRRLSCRGSFIEDISLLEKSLKESGTRSESRLIDLWHTEGSDYPFHEIPSLLASEPRDKAYAFLWALKKCRPVDFDVFDVDYTKTVETVFTEFTVAVAHDTGDFNALFRLACQQGKMSTLPSWVPDWSKAPRFQEWNFLRRFEALRRMERYEHPHLSDQEGPTFQNATMRIRGLRQADRISQLERVPAFDSTDSLYGRIFLPYYNPRAVESLCVATDKIFQMLDDADGLVCLTKLFWYARIGRDEVPSVYPHEIRCLIPGALDRPYTLDYVILRGIIRSYIRAKRSPDPSDVDISEWSRGLAAEFKELLTEETIEYVLQDLSLYEDYTQGALNEHNVEAHIVTQLIQSFHVFDIFLDAEDAEFVSGTMGATIFKTEGGALGLGQAGIDVGDEVVQWKGVPCPTVVRMLETGKGPDSKPEDKCCRLVSVAIVDGITGTGEDWREEDLITYVVL